MRETLGLTCSAVSRSGAGFGDFESIWQGVRHETNVSRDLLNEEEFANHFGDE